MLRRQDSVVIAGTGSGKTLCLLIPILLRPKSISITISPLKRLQTTQVSVLLPVSGLTNVRRGIQVLESERFGIRTITINEDTPNDESLWNVSGTRHLCASLLYAVS